jgi:hypothetical protein
LNFENAKLRQKIDGRGIKRGRIEAAFLKENQDNVPRGTYFNQNNSFNPS